MDKIMDELQGRLYIDDKEKAILREWLIRFSCYSDKTAVGFAEMIKHELHACEDEQREQADIMWILVLY